MHSHGPLLRFLLLCGTRIQETQLAQWSDIDFKKKRWNIPAQNTKSHRAHWIALPPLALDVLNTLPRGDGNVFPKRTATGVQSWLKRWCEREKIIPAFSPHDLRRTLATRMNELGIAPHVVEAILNHKLQGVAGIYNRSQYEIDRVEAQTKWSKELARLSSGMSKTSGTPKRRATSKRS
jgi:integrase